MSLYQSLGLRPIINANATLTRLGGSLMPPEVLAAMNEAAACFVDLPEMQRAVGQRIAELTRNEAAYVSSGAAAGLALATAVCVAGDDPERVTCFPHLDGLPSEVIIHRTQRNGYDYAVRQTGVQVVEIGRPGQQTQPADLEAAFSSRTAAVFWFHGGLATPDDLPLPEVIAIAHAHNVPVIVDAAAQLPPASNLWYFTRDLGADLALFSGGKDLRGPQSSGLMLGRAGLIEACHIHASPNQGFGRPMKVGKEEMAGLLAAVERYLTLDHTARERYCETTVKNWCAALNTLDGVTAERSFPNEAAQPLPRCLVTLAPGVDRDAVVVALLAGDPAISVATSAAHGIYLNPMTLEPGEEHIVQQRLIDILMHTNNELHGDLK